MPRQAKQAAGRNTKTRGNGLGTIISLPNGRFRWQFTLRFDKNGKQKRMSGTEKTRTAAHKAMTQAQTDHARGTLALPSNVTLSEYVERWLNRKKGVEASTLENYKTVLAYILEHLGHSKITDIKTHHIRDAFATVSEQVVTRGISRGQQISSRTLTQALGRLRAVFLEAYTDGIIARDPTVGIKPIKALKTENPGIAIDLPEVMRFREIGEALHAAGVSRLWPALFTALNTGLRRGELLGLRWQDIDLERDVLHVRQNLTLTRGKPQLKGYTKTEAGQRTLKIEPSLKAVLLRHRAHQDAELALTEQKITSDTPIFATNTGAYTHPDNLNRALRDLLEWSKIEPLERQGKSGKKTIVTFEERLRRIPGAHRFALRAAVMSGETLTAITPHDLRHTCGTLWLRKRIPVEVVSKWLGHNDINVTMKVYRHVLESESAEYGVDFFAATATTQLHHQAAIN
jgi:integrase